MENGIFIDYYDTPIAEKINNIEKKVNSIADNNVLMNDKVNEVTINIKDIETKLSEKSVIEQLLININNKLNIMSHDISILRKELSMVKDTVCKQMVNNSVEIDRLVNSSLRSHTPIKVHYSSIFDMFKK